MPNLFQEKFQNFLTILTKTINLGWNWKFCKRNWRIWKVPSVWLPL